MQPIAYRLPVRRTKPLPRRAPSERQVRAALARLRRAAKPRPRDRH